MNKAQGEDTDDETEVGEEEWWEWGSESGEEEEEDPIWFVDDYGDPPAFGPVEQAQRERDAATVREDTQRFFELYQNYERPGAMSTTLQNIERNVAQPLSTTTNLYRRVLFRNRSTMKQLLESLIDMVCDEEVISMNRRHAIVLLSRFLATADKPVMPKTAREASLNMGTWMILRGDDAENLHASLWVELKKMLDESDNKMYYLSDKDFLMTQTYVHPYLATLHVLHYLRYDWKCVVVPSWLLIPPKWQPHTPLPNLRVQEDVELFDDLRKRVVKVAKDLWSLQNLSVQSVDHWLGGEDGIDDKLGSIAEQLGFWPNPTYAARPYVPATGIMKALQDCRALPWVPTRLTVATALYVLAIYTHVLRDRVRDARLRQGDGSRIYDEDRLSITCTKLRRVAEFAVETTEPTLQRGGKAAEDTMRAFFWRRIEPNRAIVKHESRDREEEIFSAVHLRVVPLIDSATMTLTAGELTTALSGMARDWPTSMWPDDYDPSPAAMENARKIEQAERELQLAKARAEPRYNLRSQQRNGTQ